MGQIGKSTKYQSCRKEEQADDGQKGDKTMNGDLMTAKDWESTWHPNFTIKEKWGDPMKVVKELVMRLQTMRSMCAKPVILHTVYATSGHLEHSQHYLGRAADLHIKGLPLSIQLYYAIRAGFHGIGVYPYWEHPGLHCDVRRLEDGYPNHMWLRNDKGLYHSVDVSTYMKIIRGDYDNIKRS